MASSVSLGSRTATPTPKTPRHWDHRGGHGDVGGAIEGRNQVRPFPLPILPVAPYRSSGDAWRSGIFSHREIKSGTVGWLNQFAREMEAGLPYRKADGKPGFVNKLTADLEDKIRKVA